MGFPFFSKTKTTASTSVGLTESGRRAASKFSSSGMKFVILSALFERSPQSVNEIAQDKGLEVDEVKSWVEMLERQGIVRRIPTGDGQ